MNDIKISPVLFVLLVLTSALTWGLVAHELTHVVDLRAYDPFLLCIGSTHGFILTSMCPSSERITRSELLASLAQYGVVIIIITGCYWMVTKK